MVSDQFLVFSRSFQCGGVFLVISRSFQSRSVQQCVLRFVVILTAKSAKIYARFAKFFSAFLSFRRKEKSPQVAPQRESNLCRVSRGDFSLRRNDKLCGYYSCKEFVKISLTQMSTDYL